MGFGDKFDSALCAVQQLCWSLGCCNTVCIETRGGCTGAARCVRPNGMFVPALRWGQTAYPDHGRDKTHSWVCLPIQTRYSPVSNPNPSRASQASNRKCTDPAMSEVCQAVTRGIVAVVCSVPCPKLLCGWVRTLAPPARLLLMTQCLLWRWSAAR